MKNFSEQINNKVFKNYIVEHDYTKDNVYIEHKTKIQSEALKKIVKKLYYQFADKMDYESFVAEFQTQLYLASQRFAKGKTEQELQQVLDDVDSTDYFLKYMRVVIKARLYDEYVQTNESLTDKFVDQEYYDLYMMDVEEATTNPIKKWYFENKKQILTKSQLEFLEHLNKGTAKEVYSKQDIYNRKKRIQEAILKAYQKNFR